MLGLGLSLGLGLKAKIFGLGALKPKRITYHKATHTA